MNLDDLCRKYDVSHGKAYDFSLFVEYRLIKREKGLLAYFFIDRSKYQDKVINLMDRYYRRKTK